MVRSSRLGGHQLTKPLSQISVRETTTPHALELVLSGTMGIAWLVDKCCCCAPFISSSVNPGRFRDVLRPVRESNPLHRQRS